MPTYRLHLANAMLVQGRQIGRQDATGRGQMRNPTKDEESEIKTLLSENRTIAKPKKHPLPDGRGVHLGP